MRRCARRQGAGRTLRLACRHAIVMLAAATASNASTFAFRMGSIRKLAWRSFEQSAISNMTPRRSETNLPSAVHGSNIGERSWLRTDRKRVVWGKRVSGRVDHGGSRFNNKQIE